MKQTCSSELTVLWTVANGLFAKYWRGFCSLSNVKVLLLSCFPCFHSVAVRVLGAASELRAMPSAWFYWIADKRSVTAWAISDCALSGFYGSLGKLSPAALEQPYGGSGEVLQLCCSIVTGLPEKVYQRPGKSRQPTCSTLARGAEAWKNEIYRLGKWLCRCAILAYLAAVVRLLPNVRVFRAEV